MLVTIVIPAYNEERVIEAHLEAILAHCDPKPWDFEVLVVDDGSRDATAAKVRVMAERDARVRLLEYGGNRGKGHAVRTGLMAGTGDVRGFTDADASTHISELDRVLEAIEAGAQVVIGSRAKQAEEVQLEVKIHRKVIGRVFNALLRMLVGLEDRHGNSIADSQCGFKWFSAAACDSIVPRAKIDGFAFDVELLYLASRLGFQIEELPISWSDQGESSVNLLLDPIKMLYHSALVPIRHRRHGS